MTTDKSPVPIDPQVRIGHVHLKVADLERSQRFYCGVLGFELTQRYGTQAAFVSAGGYHHHIGLNTWESLGGSPPPAGTTGLYHVAILYPTRRALADALQRLLGAGIQLDGASDHGVSEAIYLRDPDENGVELYWDRPKDEWPRSPQGEISMYTKRLDLNALLKEIESGRDAPDAQGKPIELVHRIANGKETIQVTCFSHATNAVILQTPGRAFPGMVFQGDTLRNLYRAVEKGIESFDSRNFEVARECLCEIAEELQHRLAFYEKVLKSHGFSLPYSGPVSDDSRNMTDS